MSDRPPAESFHQGLARYPRMGEALKPGPSSSIDHKDSAHRETQRCRPPGRGVRDHRQLRDQRPGGAAQNQRRDRGAGARGGRALRLSSRSAGRRPATRPEPLPGIDHSGPGKPQLRAHRQVPRTARAGGRLPVADRQLGRRAGQRAPTGRTVPFTALRRAGGRQLPAAGRPDLRATGRRRPAGDCPRPRARPTAHPLGGQRRPAGRRTAHPQPAGAFARACGTDRRAPRAAHQPGARVWTVSSAS